MKSFTIDLSDFHSHVLPGADHGSDSTDTSLAQLELARIHGVTRIVATPHFYPHRHMLADFLKRRENSYLRLSERITEEMPSIKLGAEVLACPGLERLDGLRELCLGNSEYLLLELPFSDFGEDYYTTVQKIIRAGYKVILAHVDRYSRESIEKMLDVGVTMLQLNATSLSGMFKKKHLFEWVRQGYVHAIGSDIHGADKSAYKCFDKAKRALGDFLPKIAEKSDSIWNLI